MWILTAALFLQLNSKGTNGALKQTYCAFPDFVCASNPCCCFFPPAASGVWVLGLTSAWSCLEKFRAIMHE